MTPTPPPPPPPPSNSLNFSSKVSTSKPTEAPNTSALLKSIEKGTKLKKAITNDRSAPIVSTNSNSKASNSVSTNQNLSTESNNSSNLVGMGGLFAKGFPVLRSYKKSSENERDKSKPSQPPISTILKHPMSNATEYIAQNPEKTYGAVKRSAKIAGPILASEMKSQIDKSEISIDITSNTKNIGKRLSKISISSMPKSLNFEPNTPNKWSFEINDEMQLIKPRKHTGCKKIYLSQMNTDIFKKSGAHISEEDIDIFINTMKSKLNKAASEEKFEECVRLKKKLHAFEDIRTRIKCGDQILSSDLPK